MVPRPSSSSARGCSVRPSGAASPGSPRTPWPTRRRFGSRAWGRRGPSASSPSPIARTSATRSPRAAAAAQIPAGFTYLGQFIDHDLTFDMTNVTFGEHVSPSELLQARSPSLDLDSLYGAGPQDPDSAKFYAADGLHLKMGKTVAVGIDAAMDGFDLPRGAGSTAAQKRTAIIPDPRNDENLAVAQTHLAFIRFHNRVVDTLPAAVPQCAALREGARARHQALPVDDPHRLPAADLRAGRRQQRVHRRAQGVRAGRTGHPGPDDADRVLGRRASGSGTR